jgi:hypothetical protein
MPKTLLEIQEDLIKKYDIVIVKDSKCWGRTHAHCDGTRRICKWEPKKSIVSTFALLHEIGHIVTFKGWMKRAEGEFYATQWALERAAELKLEIPDKLITVYQDYIDYTKDRGVRRGGSGYGKLILCRPETTTSVAAPVSKPKTQKPKKTDEEILHEAAIDDIRSCKPIELAAGTFQGEKHLDGSYSVYSVKNNKYKLILSGPLNICAWALLAEAGAQEALAAKLGIKEER